MSNCSRTPYRKYLNAYVLVTLVLLTGSITAYSQQCYSDMPSTVFVDSLDHEYWDYMYTAYRYAPTFADQEVIELFTDESCIIVDVDYDEPEYFDFWIIPDYHYAGVLIRDEWIYYPYGMRPGDYHYPIQPPYDQEYPQSDVGYVSFTIYDLETEDLYVEGSSVMGTIWYDYSY